MQCSESMLLFHQDGPARLARPKRKTTSALTDVAESNAADRTYMYLRGIRSGRVVAHALSMPFGVASKRPALTDVRGGQAADDQIRRRLRQLDHPVDEDSESAPPR